MKYILQVKEAGKPEWTDFQISEDVMVIEDTAKEKANYFPLSSMRVVKEVALHINLHVKIID